MSLAMKAARGAVWSILTGLGSRSIGLISTLVLTRFIPPADYGAISVATIIVLSASDLTGLGLFHWVIATPKASRSSIFHATFYHLLAGALAFAAVLLWKDRWGPLFGSTQAVTYIPGLVLAMAFMRISYPAERILVRDLRFGPLGILRGITEVLYATVAIGAAVFGFGAMSIVYGNLIQWSVFLAGCLYLSSWREWIEPARLTWRQTKEIFSFGLPMTFGDIAHRAAKTWDNLLVSRFFGEATVGRYNLAYNLADIPATHVGEHIGEVLLPSFARLDADARAEGLIRSTRLLGIIIFPMAVGLSVIAPTATAAIFDPRWGEMAPMLLMLAALSVVRPLGWTIGSYQLAERQPVMVMTIEIAKVILLLGLMLLLAPKGIL
ncbi:MAG: oligosaccharide flippase family protein, partial [Deltaproteobacteria bacterium]|nr:oligosaccharide flippase family protein [Deltaproteobacteria bacterium]